MIRARLCACATRHVCHAEVAEKRASGKGLAGHFEGNVRVDGEVHVTRDITCEFADCAEDFDVAGAALVEPGTVMGGPLGAAIGALVAGGEDILGAGGASVLAARTRDELAELKRKLDAYPAWPIGLIYGDEVLFWEQHQLVATRYGELPDGRLQLRIWDNNHLVGANDGEEWIVDAGGDEVSVTGAGKDIKGIICDRYEPVEPPRL